MFHNVDVVLKYYFSDLKIEVQLAVTITKSIDIRINLLRVKQYVIIFIAITPNSSQTRL